MMDIADRATSPRELRAFDHALEMRADADDRLTFEGIASVVDTPYVVRDHFGEFAETIAPGAFNRTIKQKADVRLLVNHDGVPLARTKSKTLSLAADPHLRAMASLDPANPTVQEIRSAMSRGDIDQMSIGFRVKDQEWSKDYTERIIREIELFDVSIVTFPASSTTSATVRSFDDFLANIADLDLTEDDVRRGYEHFRSLLPAPTTPEADANAALRLALWQLRHPPAA
jgi:hypothetical protein